MPVTTGLIVGGTVALGSAISAQSRKNKAEKALRNMPDPRYSATPQTLSFYDQAVRESIAPRGMSEQEKGAAFQDIAGITTGNIRNARRLGGGNISGQINASLNNAAVIGATQYGRQDAMLRSQNRMNAYNRLWNVTSTLQGLQNNNTGLDVQKQIGLGAAIRDARMERDQAIQGIGSAAFGVAGMGMGGNPNGYQGSGQTTTATPPINPNYKTPYMYNPSFMTQSTQMQEPTWFTPEQPNMLSPQNRFTPYNLNPFSPAPPPRYIK